MMLCLLKRLRERDAHLKTGGGWRDERLEGQYLGRPEEDGYGGLAVGLVGLGRVGRRVARLLQGWDARIVACDPYVGNDVFSAAGVERMDYETLLRTADIVSLHVTLNRETRHMLGGPQLAMMKPSAVLLGGGLAPGIIWSTRSVLKALAGVVPTTCSTRKSFRAGRHASPTAPRFSHCGCVRPALCARAHVPGTRLPSASFAPMMRRWSPD